MTLQEIKNAFIDLIRIPSITGSAGEETACAYLEAILDSYGISHERVCRVPERPNLLACIRAENPTLEPVVLISHIDVVAGDESKWSHGVFSGDIADGNIHAFFQKTFCSGISNAGSATSDNYSSTFHAVHKITPSCLQCSTYVSIKLYLACANTLVTCSHTSLYRCGDQTHPSVYDLLTRGEV